MPGGLQLTASPEICHTPSLHCAVVELGNEPHAFMITPASYEHVSVTEQESWNFGAVGGQPAGF